MTRRLAGLLFIVCTLSFPAGASALPPSGPRLSFLRSTDSRFELVSADPLGEDQQLIAGGGTNALPLPLPLSSLSWSGDGATVAFSGLSGDEANPQYDIYLAAADGSGVRKVPGTRDGLDPVLSPDGRTLAFIRISRRPKHKRPGHRIKLSVWIVDTSTGSVSKLGSSRRPEIPSSFSPDGAALAVTRQTGEWHSDALTIDLATGRNSVLAHNASGPVYSPDGSKIAFERGPVRTFHSEGGTTTEPLTDIYVVNVDGPSLIRVTKTPHQIELAPSWGPSGKRLAYTQFHAGASEANFLGIGDSIMEINTDGSCRTKILSVPAAILYGATWQPGPGREAGPIAC